MSNKINYSTIDNLDQEAVDRIESLTHALANKLSVAVHDFALDNFDLKDNTHTNTIIDACVVQNAVMNFASHHMLNIMVCVDKRDQDKFLCHCQEIFLARFEQQESDKVSH